MENPIQLDDEMGYPHDLGRPPYTKSHISQSSEFLSGAVSVCPEGSGQKPCSFEAWSLIMWRQGEYLDGLSALILDGLSLFRYMIT
jgi:hypothetical protein